MNKYFLLLITSFASLTLNAASASRVDINPPLVKDLTFVERGGCPGGEIVGARETARQEWYRLKNETTGYSYFVQDKADGKEGAGRDSYVNGTTVSVTNAAGETVYLNSHESFYETNGYLNLCRKNQGKFPVPRK